jgi:hypothetical protein
MKAIMILVLAILGGGLLTGCESDHHHRHGYYGRPPAYEYGTGPRYDRDWDHH